MKPKPVIEAMGVHARTVRRQLDYAASQLTRSFDSVMDEALPNSTAPQFAIDAHRLNLAAPGTLIRQSTNNGQLQAANHQLIRFDNDQLLTRIGIHLGKRFHIRGGYGICQILPSRAEVVIRQKSYDCAHVLRPGSPKQ